MGIIERKEREKMMRREAIMDSVISLYSRKGIENITMDDIATEAELSKGTLYLYFKSKEEIHWVITTRAIRLLSEKANQEIDPNDDAISNLKKIGNLFVDFFNQNKAVANMMLYFQGSDLSNLNLSQESIENAFTTDSPIYLVRKYVEIGMNQGIIRNDLSCNSITNTLWAQLLGVVQIITKKKEIFDIFHITQDEIIKTHFEIVINGLAK
ncbi:MAG: TetR/AcrR family transcriptional regulator [Bacteroidales bacterium]|nr:TetR/AcrR family transcriptional regulator [Bacteroidales bacterium]